MSLKTDAVMAERDQVRTAVQALREKYRADEQLQQDLARLLALEEGLAAQFLGQIRQLYRIEREAKALAPEHRCKLRRQKAPAFWKAMHQRALRLQPQPRHLQPV